MLVLSANIQNYALEFYVPDIYGNPPIVENRPLKHAGRFFWQVMAVSPRNIKCQT
jgi:hypothetical protein